MVVEAAQWTAGKRHLLGNCVEARRDMVTKQKNSVFLFQESDGTNP